MTTTQTMKPHTLTVSQLKALYAERNPSGHYFDRDTMKFFASKIHKARILQNGDIVFITSEKAGFRSEEPKRNVRKLSMNGKIETMHDFCQISNIEANRIYRAAL